MSDHLTCIDAVESSISGASRRRAACVCGWAGPERAATRLGLELATDDAINHERHEQLQKRAEHYEPNEHDRSAALAEGNRIAGKYFNVSSMTSGQLAGDIEASILSELVQRGQDRVANNAGTIVREDSHVVE